MNREYEEGEKVRNEQREASIERNRVRNEQRDTGEEREKERE